MDEPFQDVRGSKNGRGSEKTVSRDHQRPLEVTVSRNDACDLIQLLQTLWRYEIYINCQRSVRERERAEVRAESQVEKREEEREDRRTSRQLLPIDINEVSIPWRVLQ